MYSSNTKKVTAHPLEISWLLSNYLKNHHPRKNAGLYHAMIILNISAILFDINLIA
jgi:hypothetical protein